MDPSPETILIIDGDASSRAILEDLLRHAGYEVSSADSCQGVLESARSGMVDLLVLDAGLPGFVCGDLLSELKGVSATAGVRVLLLESGTPQERARYLDLGADDVLSRPWDSTEMLARVRLRLRAKKSEDHLRQRTNLAERGQELSRTAFEALAVTEKMSRDAFHIGRSLKIGLAVLFIVVAAMAVIYFRFSRRATSETKDAYAAIARLNRGLTRQEDLLAQVHKISDEMTKFEANSAEARKQQLERQSQELRAQIADAPTQEADTLRGQLRKTEGRIRQIESAASVAEGIIKTYSPSVCLIHVTVAIREQSSGRPLRYVGLAPDGEPLIDLKGQPAITLDGTGPEVRVHGLGSGFLAAAGGRIVTNHHVVEPWWEDESLGSMKEQGLESVISEMEAFFPGSSSPFKCVTEKISTDADLAVVRVELGDLKREILSFDALGEASLSGQAVVLMGYPTGIDAILARTDESTVREIVNASRGQLKGILAELARRNLIRPIVTQGHIGDVLKDKIVYDAQTTSGGSGGPLFNRRAKVVGINFAIVKDFGGSNFGIPGRFAQALLRP
jgi:DNA-binding response OmpR family regulator/S1-C subfamily serine protease